MSDENEQHGQHGAHAEEPTRLDETIETAGRLQGVVSRVSPNAGAGIELVHGAHGIRNGVRQFRRGERADGALATAGGVQTVANGAMHFIHHGAEHAAEHAAHALTHASGPERAAALERATHTAERAERFGRWGSRIGHAGNVLSVGTGLYNLNQARRNWHHDPNRAEQQASTGTQSLLSGGIGIGTAIAGGAAVSVGGAATLGLGLGAWGEGASNDYTRRTGQYGQSQFTTHRGMGDARPGEVQNRDNRDVAAEAGLDVRRRLGGGTMATAAGFVTAGALSPFVTAHAGLHAIGLAGVNQGTGDIEAQDAEERHAPLRRSDQSELAQRRREIHRRAEARRRAQEAQQAQLQQQMAAEGHRDIMQNPGAGTHFMPIAANNQNVERAALGMAPVITEDDLARGLAAMP